MKSINSKTGKPFERGDIREDGYYFYRYRMDRKLNPDGFYKEEWSSNPVRKTAKWITTEKAKIKGSKRINPETNKPFERGDIREDGYIFQEYQKNILKNNGYLSEIWSSPDAYNRRKIQQAKYAKISRVKYNPKIHKRRLNPKTGEEFKIGDRDGDGRFFLLYHSEVQKNKTDVLERWAETSEDFRRFLMHKKVQRSLLPILKLTPIYTSKGRVSAIGNITVRAKSGTMHYIRGLAGYICKEDIPVMAFSIFSADLEKRKENLSNNFERPKGSSAWLSRAVIQERQIIRKIIGQI